MTMFSGSSWSAKWGFDEFVGDWPWCGGLPPEKKSIAVSSSHVNTGGIYTHGTCSLLLCLFRPDFSPSSTSGAPTCCRPRSRTPWASAGPPATPTRPPAARCPLMTTTPRSWVSGEGNLEAWAASSFSRDSTAWWGRWPAGAESPELTLGVLKVNFWPLTRS